MLWKARAQIAGFDYAFRGYLGLNCYLGSAAVKAANPPAYRSLLNAQGLGGGLLGAEMLYQLVKVNVHDSPPV